LAERQPPQTIDEYNLSVILIMNQIQIHFYPDDDNGPIKDYLDELKVRHEKAHWKLIKDLNILRLEGLRSPSLTIRPMGAGLWELKRLYDGIQYRIFFCMSKGAAWLLHCIEKKSSKTPHSDLRLAVRRMKEIMR